MGIFKGKKPFAPWTTESEPPLSGQEQVAEESQAIVRSDVVENFPISFINDDTAHSLYHALESADDGKNYTLFNVLLSEPVESIVLEGRRRMGRVGLQAMITFEDEKVAKQMLDGLMEEAAQRYELAPSKLGGMHIVTGESGLSFTIGSGRTYSTKRDIVISTGKIKESYDSYASIIDEPYFTKEGLQVAVSEVLGAVTLGLAVAYDKQGILPESRKIGLDLPPKRIELMSSLYKNEVESIPEDISKKFGVEYPKVSFDDIGGQVSAKREMRNISSALVSPEIYQKWGTRPPKGVLLHGPPGTGKTLLAKALASEANAAFYSISPSDIGSKWYGESEQRVKGLFEAAAKQDRAIIYFDEIDAVMPNRDNGAHEATQRVISTILQSIDGVQSKSNVLIVASTNRLEVVDPAMLRPGRLDRLVEAALPDADERKTIFGIHMRRAEEQANRQLFDNSLDDDALTVISNEFSGADIAEIIRRTLENKVLTESATGVEPSKVSQVDIIREITDYERKHKSAGRIGFTNL
ncbi:MAG: ATP-binding protein [Patescibacteria group bacterium]